MSIKISRGPLKSKPARVVIYGPEGIGKSTFAAQFPAPIFIDTEGSTDLMDVARFEKPTSWEMLLSEVEAVKQDAANNPPTIKTLVIDTADWMERLCESYVCKKYAKGGIEDFGYGKGYVYVKEEFGKVLDTLTEINRRGVNIVITAHCLIRKFELPNETGAFDRYELKLGGKAGNQTAALVKEWADIVLFANYKEIVTEVNGKNKVQGGRRVMYASHAPTWDAKNRYGLPDEMPFDYQQIAKYIPDNTGNAPVTPSAAPQEPPKQARKETPAPKKKAAQKADEGPAPFDDEQSRDGVDERVLALIDKEHYTLNELSCFAQESNCMPGFVPVNKMPKAFIEQVILGQWEKVKRFMSDKGIHLENKDIPF